MAPTYDWPWVETQVSRASEAWGHCSILPLPGVPKYNPAEQRRRETIYDRALLAVERETPKKPGATTDRATLQNRLIQVFGEFAATALDLPGDAIDLITRDFVSLGAEFARQARRFDHFLPMNEIFQACRNAWTAGGLQSLLGQQPSITPSILGYSLLYPYSDNFIDGKKISGNEKTRFSARFRSRLRGETLAPENRREAAIWRSIELIEIQYPRADYPQVYDCLLAIHRAQELSLTQLQNSSHASDEELLRISFAKGGTSVLVDACLASGRIRESNAELAFDWGAVLQLGDDLQDVGEDLRRGSQTLFTRAIRSGCPLDSLATQLLNFSEHVATRMNQFPCGTTTLKNLLRISWRSIILAAIAEATEYFSPAFLDAVEAGSPFGFDFLESRNKKLARRNGIYTRLFHAILEEPATPSPASPAAPYIPSPIDTNCRIWSSSAR
jgi:hypothetical protein